MTTYRRDEVAHLRVGDEFIDHADVPHVVTGFGFFPDSPGIATVYSDHAPAGVIYPTTTQVWVARPKHGAQKPKAKK